LRDHGCRQIIGRDATYHRFGLAAAEPGEWQGHHLRQVRPWRPKLRACREHNENPLGRHVSKHLTDKFCCRGINPVGILDNHKDWASPLHCESKPRQGSEDSSANLFRIFWGSF
jgi:hypothetical protein